MIWIFACPDLHQVEFNSVKNISSPVISKKPKCRTSGEMGKIHPLPHIYVLLRNDTSWIKMLGINDTDIEVQMYILIINHTLKCIDSV
jgi:hypothetical protein